jgi:hypothetical protein
MKQTIYTDSEKTVVVWGKLFNETTIKLPEEWESTVNPKTIVVLLTPCGAEQNIFVKTINAKEVTLSTNRRFPIECYYQVWAELLA